MKWIVNYTISAERDLRCIYEYISNTLCAPDTAKNLIRKIMDEISSLEEMPNRFARYDNKPWYDRGLRFFSVKNYIVFYLSNEETKTVSVIRILYGGRDVEKQLL